MWALDSANQHAESAAARSKEGVKGGHRPTQSQDLARLTALLPFDPKGHASQGASSLARYTPSRSTFPAAANPRLGHSAKAEEIPTKSDLCQTRLTETRFRADRPAQLGCGQVVLLLTWAAHELGLTCVTKILWRAWVMGTRTTNLFLFASSLIKRHPTTLSPLPAFTKHPPAAVSVLFLILNQDHRY